MEHRLERILPYAPDDLFALVGDVGRYPEFVPWLTRMRVSNPQVLGEGIDSVDAEATVSFAFLTERFSTRVVRNAPAHEVRATLIRGPFRALDNRWRFQPHPTGTMIDFYIDFAFSSKLLDALLNANMSRAADRLIGCFDERARVLYGPKP
ncbi:MAG TPA: type II toxin-antitoxin system RatA family toxin [Caulobacteraceae bacterium]|nr:type II toxin-antitoxin system RatA family toxin [Caulobacteraceae bacterium]